MTTVQNAFDRAQKAREAMNIYQPTGNEIADEFAFGRLEAEFLEASMNLSIAVELALGVEPKALAALLA